MQHSEQDKIPGEPFWVRWRPTRFGWIMIIVAVVFCLVMMLWPSKIESKEVIGEIFVRALVEGDVETVQENACAEFTDDVEVLVTPADAAQTLAYIGCLSEGDIITCEYALDLGEDETGPEETIYLLIPEDKVCEILPVEGGE